MRRFAMWSAALAGCYNSQCPDGPTCDVGQRACRVAAPSAPVVKSIAVYGPS